jgi:hypothetical protein
MKILSCLLLVLLAFVVAPDLSGCANNSGSLQSRIEHKVDNPESENVQIGTAHYNSYSKGFEEAWPFGPYSK